MDTMRIRSIQIIIALITTCGLASVRCLADDVYAYRLIEGKNTIRYFDGTVELYAPITGLFRFAVSGDQQVTMRNFDIRIQGEFRDYLGMPGNIAFGPGDSLSDLFDVDFSRESGIVVERVSLIPNPPDLPPTIHVGPQVQGDANQVFLGLDFLNVFQLGPVETFLELKARGKDSIGGRFSLFPPGRPSDGFGILLLDPNIRLVPEPSSLALLFLAASGVGVRARSRAHV